MELMAVENELHARFCRNVRARRRALGMTQQQLAEALGVTQPTIAELETGRRSPTLTTVAAMAKALGLPADGLLAAELEPVS